MIQEMTSFQSYLPFWERSEPPPTPFPNKTSNTKIESYKPGYPRFTALISAHDHYFVCRRFDKLRARLLLQKQDKLAMLEERLEYVDNEETFPLYLGKSRCDQNKERTSLLSKIDSHLADYDRFLERTTRALSLGPAQSRDVDSLQNWVESTGCVAREETAYLAHHELVSLAPEGDSAVGKLEAWVEDKLIRFWPTLIDIPSCGISNDPNVYVYSGMHMQHFARVILLLLVTILLLGPIIVCNVVSTNSWRMVIVVASTVVFLLVLSRLSQPKTMKLILLGATYATVLIEFVR